MVGVVEYTFTKKTPEFTAVLHVEHVPIVNALEQCSAYQIIGDMVICLRSCRHNMCSFLYLSAFVEPFVWRWRETLRPMSVTWLGLWIKISRCLFRRSQKQSHMDTFDNVSNFHTNQKMGQWVVHWKVIHKKNQKNPEGIGMLSSYYTCTPHPWRTYPLYPMFDNYNDVYHFIIRKYCFYWKRSITTKIPRL